MIQTQDTVLFAKRNTNRKHKYCVKSVRVWSYSGPYFPAFGLNTERYGVSPYSVRMRENTDQNNSEYGHFLHSEKSQKKSNLKGNLKIKRNRITIFIYCCLSGITSTTNSRQKLTETF